MKDPSTAGSRIWIQGLAAISLDQPTVPSDVADVRVMSAMSCCTRVPALHLPRLHVHESPARARQQVPEGELAA